MYFPALSQATATRAGILYISEGRQWHNMVQSWLQKVAKPYAEKAKWKVSSANLCNAAQLPCFRMLHLSFLPATATPSFNHSPSVAVRQEIVYRAGCIHVFKGQPEV
jgi:hypothetical protein